MKRCAGVLALVAALAGSGCVSAAGVWKQERVTLPMFAVAVTADLVVAGLIASQVQDFTAGAAIGTAVAVTAVDVAVGCFLGACAPLHL